MGLRSRLIWNQNVEPRLGWLWKEISPPISFTGRWVMTSPRPVPPWRREMLASAAERTEQTRLIAFRNADTGIVDLDFDLDA